MNSYFSISELFSISMLAFTNSKFRVMISKNMLDVLKDVESEGYDKLLSFIDESVNKMKTAELKFDGNLKWLCFGVKLYDDG